MGIRGVFILAAAAGAGAVALKDEPILRLLLKDLNLKVLKNLHISLIITLLSLPRLGRGHTCWLYTIQNLTWRAIPNRKELEIPVALETAAPPNEPIRRIWLINPKQVLHRVYHRCKSTLGCSAILFGV